MIALPDVNVLVAMAWANHLHHKAAHEWFSREADQGWATCLLTQSAFMRLSMNTAVVGLAIDCVSAQGLLQSLVSHPSHQFIESCPSLAAQSFDDLSSRVRGYQQVADATLLHLARYHKLRLITFDQAIGTLCPWAENIETLIP